MQSAVTCRFDGDKQGKYECKLTEHINAYVYYYPEGISIETVV